MSSREFLNVAHAVLVEEFTRTRMVRGITIPGMPLEEALAQAAPWAEGYRQPPPEPELVQETVPPAGRQTAAGEAAEKSEAEIVAQNQLAMQHLMGRVSGMKGGFSRN